MVVPRSANVVASDDEYTLYTVTTFKKHSPEFQHKAREKKWVPRDFKFKEGGKEEEAREVDRVGEEEKKVWGETLRLGRTGWSEGVMVLIHVMNACSPTAGFSQSSQRERYTATPSGPIADLY